MARKQIFNPIKLHSELAAADSAINPLLEAAKINSIKVDGKDVPASEAPMADRVLAFSSVSKSAVGNLDMSELIAANDALSKQNDKTAADLAIANSSVTKLQGDVATLTTDLQTSQASVNTLTAANAELQNRHDASIRQVGELTKQANSINTALSAMCLEYGCLDLATEDGKVLAKDASDDVKLAAANRIPIADKLKASKGAVNAAMSKLGLSNKDLPAPGMPNRAASDKKEVTGRDRMKSAMKIEGVTV